MRLPFPFEMPCDLPVPGDVPGPTEFERFVEFLGLYFLAFGLMLLALPRRWFVWCFRTLFPFLPELEGQERKRINTEVTEVQSTEDTEKTQAQKRSLD